jgi:hypothetical protein
MHLETCIMITSLAFSHYLLRIYSKFSNLHQNYVIITGCVNFFFCAQTHQLHHLSHQAMASKKKKSIDDEEDEGASTKKQKTSSSKELKIEVQTFIFLLLVRVSVCAIN